MDPNAIALFRELADRHRSEREAYYAQHQVPASVRDEVESLLRFDDPSDSLAGDVAAAAERALSAGVERYGPPPATNPAPAPRQPVSIGRYEVVRLLGRGGMGEVYLAHDPVLDRNVALKLFGEALDDGEARTRMAQEARAAGRLRHPNIVTIFDAGEHEGRPYTAMEYVPGETLGSLIRRRAPLPLGRKLELIEGACAGLAHAHREGVVHLDIKPDNLMVDEAGLVRVLDFGIARILKGDWFLTRHLVGTLRYMSPEQLAGRSIDRRSDVFSLGCSLFELVSDAPAYSGSTAEIVTRIVTGRPPRLSDAVPGIDPRLDAITTRAMAADPSQRYDHLEVLRDALAQLRAEIDPPVLATISQRSPRAHRSLWSRLSPITATIAAVTALAAGAGVFLTFRSPDRSAIESAGAPVPPRAPAETAAAISEPRATSTTVLQLLRSPASDRPGSADGQSMAMQERQAAPVLPSDESTLTPPASTVASERIAEPVRPLADESPRSEPEPVIPTAVDTPTMPGSTGSPPPAPSQTDAILDALHRYQDAYRALDVSRVLQVFPSLSGDQVGQLRRTFAGTRAYEIALRNPRVNAEADVATVHALVGRRIVPRIGQPVANEVEMEFRLRREGDKWVITVVTALLPSPASRPSR